MGRLYTQSGKWENKLFILFNLFLYKMDLQSNRKIETIKKKLLIMGKNTQFRICTLSAIYFFIHLVLHKKD